MKRTNLKSLSVILFVILSGLLGSCRKEMTSSDNKTNEAAKLNVSVSSGSVAARSKLCSLTPWYRGTDGQYTYWYSYMSTFVLVIITPNGALSIPFGNEGIRFRAAVPVMSAAGASKQYCDAWNAAIDALSFQLQNNNIPISVPDIQFFMNTHMSRTWAINGAIAERSPSSWPNLPWGGALASVTICP